MFVHKIATLPSRQKYFTEVTQSHFNILKVLFISRQFIVGEEWYKTKPNFLLPLLLLSPSTIDHQSDSTSSISISSLRYNIFNIFNIWNWKDLGHAGKKDICPEPSNVCNILSKVDWHYSIGVKSKKSTQTRSSIHQFKF